MYKKYQNTLDNLKKVKPMLIIAIVLTLVNLCFICSKITIQDQWEVLSYYPENAYESLETEAYTMIKNKNFETDYHLVITDYDNYSNDLYFKLSDEQEPATITIFVNDYTSDNPKIDIERSSKSARSVLNSNSLLLFYYIPLVLTFVEMIALWILLTVIDFIFFIIDKLVKKFIK